MLKHNLQGSVDVVGGASIAETYRNLQQIAGGIEKECLPLCVGGTYDLDMHHAWYRQRMEIEFAQIRLSTSTIHCKLNHRLGVLINKSNNRQSQVSRKQTVKEKPKVLFQWVDHRQPGGNNVLEAKYL